MELILNGKRCEVDAPEDMPLLWVLRDKLNMTGTKFGCAHGVCGACIMRIDDAQEHACQVTCPDVAGRRLTTIEGLAGDRIGEALFTAWDELDVSQCGFCQPAQLMSASTLLERNPRPTDDDIDEALRHNLCRCGTYQRIRAAIKLAAERLNAEGGTQ
ncbi:(2Fe-2S)-binding protein [Streptomyces sp. NPDC047023]|uniref:(2Fe-2S)-binding protein n=1 Tax=Streptomyces sp. NPDC047023 TaxID=3155139 RepID=UPI0033EDF076